MTKFKLLFAVPMFATVVSCANLADISPAEWRSARTHVFKNTDKKRVFEAAEKVFRLADGSDFSFSYRKDSEGDGTGFSYSAEVGAKDSETLRATQSYFFTVVLATVAGKFFWRVTLRQVGKDVHASVGLSEWEKTIANPPVERFYNDVGGAASYRVLWQRMEYVMGRLDAWPTCAEIKAAFRRAKSRLTQYTGWCAPWSKERKPERLVAR